MASPASRHMAGAASLALPAAFAGFPVYMYAPELFTAHYGLSLGVVAIALPALRLVDAVSDPLLGYVSDRYAQYRVSIAVCSLIATVIGTLCLFAPFTEYALPRFIAGVFLATLGYSAVTVQLYIIAASLPDHVSRGRIINMREGFGLVGLLAAVILPYALQQAVDAPMSFFLTACLCAVLAVVTLPWFVRAMRKMKPCASVRQGGLGAMLHAVKHMSFPVKQFYGIYALFSLAAALPAVLAVFFINERLQADAYAGGFLLLYFIAALVCLPLWRRLAGRFGLRRIWALACFMAVIGFFGAFFLREGDVVPFIFICIASGGAFGAGLVLPSALLAQLIEDDGKHAVSGLYFSCVAFLQKSGLVLAAVIALPLLSIAGFDATTERQPDSALTALSFLYAALPCFIQCAAAVWLLRSRQSFGDIYDDAPLSDIANPSIGNIDA